ncbi:MAG: alpha/beta hydrolase [Dinoroseobacter sp.]|nr:alpha/beta hydrolase [Dinoroseobacter sp.]
MRPLVFVHGFMGGSDQWKLQAPLADTRELICVDLPGFGRNAHLAPVSTIRDFAEWVLQELSSQGVETFDLLGHSMGGMIAQEMAHLAHDRIERLILYGTGAEGVLPGRFEPIETSMARAQADGAAATGKRIAATWFLDLDAAPEYAGCAEIAALSTLPAILAGLAAMRDWSGEQYLSEIRAKTLVLWGDKDRTYAWPQIETLWKKIPDAHLAVIPESAHAVHLERAALFNQIVTMFLEKTGTRPGSGSGR